jgi:hypothetical protein
MTPTEWADVLEEIRLLWPSRPRWPDKAADRCYRQLKGFTVEMVQEAVKDLVGKYPPSPASLEERVAERAAIEAINDRYTDKALPAPDDKVSTHAESIRGNRTWAEYLEEQSS